MKLREIYFDKIKSGEKIYEIRLFDDKRRLIKVGDEIIFRKEPDLSQTLKTTVKDLIVFKSFKDMLSFLSADEIGFKGFSKEKIESVYHSFYTTKDELNYGVLAIEIEVLD